MRNISFYLPFFLLVLAACSTPNSFYRKGIASPEGYASRVGDTLRVLSWNVEHFVDDHDNPYTRNKREDTSEKMDGRVSLLLEALRKADADIVVLQEFEHVQFLKQLADDSLSDMGYKFFADHESVNWYMN
ncbi:MAG: endonuclease/exonuclease/phosphatase family protein, partial [Bacteroidota bacterium]